MEPRNPYSRPDYSPSAEFAGWVRKKTKSPLGLSAAIGAGAGLGSYLLWNSLADTAGTLFAPVGKLLTGKSDREWDADLQRAVRSKGARIKYSALLGLAGMGLPLALMYSKAQKGGGLTRWDPGMVPSGATAPMADRPFGRPELRTPGRAPSAGPLVKKAAGIDYDRAVSVPGTARLFSAPGISNYQRNFGTSVINAAPRIGSGTTTLGGIMESAANKFNSKLSVGGVASVGTRAVVANAMAKVFTTAVGGITGMSPQARRGLVRAGTWAGAVNAIIR